MEKQRKEQEALMKKQIKEEEKARTRFEKEHPIETKLKEINDALMRLR